MWMWMRKDVPRRTACHRTACHRTACHRTACNRAACNRAACDGSLARRDAPQGWSRRGQRAPWPCSTQPDRHATAPARRWQQPRRRRAPAVLRHSKFGNIILASRGKCGCRSNQSLRSVIGSTMAMRRQSPVPAWAGPGLNLCNWPPISLASDPTLPPAVPLSGPNAPVAARLLPCQRLGPQQGGSP
jgi:hypothetical protein